MISKAALAPEPDGWLAAAAPVTFPFMAPRLQGEWAADGRLSLALWGAGDLGRLRLTPLRGPVRYGPNLALADGQDFAAARSAPALALRGVRLDGVSPAQRRAGWDAEAHAKAAPRREGERVTLDLEWGHVIVETRGEDLIIAAGATPQEAQSGLALSAGAVRAEAMAHAAACDLMPEADPVLRSMVLQGAHTALSSIRRDASGAFAGLAAGLAYSAPARTYYRDGYWTAQLLLRLDPASVRRQIDLLAEAVREDGEAPSGVIVEALPEDAEDGGVDWWSDHFDSPLFFILLVGDYVAATGDDTPARAHWPRIKEILARYDRLSVGGLLPLKPRNDRDWADNVYRSGAVAYDLGLWVGALRAAAQLAGRQEPQLVGVLQGQLRGVLPALQRALWRGAWPADFVPFEGPAETHLSLDCLTLLRHDAVDEAAALQVLEAVRTTLETRANPGQPWGSWGVMCVYPPFARRADLRSKTAFGFRYHNGADWPWLDGLYAAERLRRRLPGWRYPLTRWWEWGLSRGWAGPVEYYSPAYARGGLLQGWSSYPAAVALTYAAQVAAGDAG
jgi:hypothetical protein